MTQYDIIKYGCTGERLILSYNKTHVIYQYSLFEASKWTQLISWSRSVHAVLWIFFNKRIQAWLYGPYWAFKIQNSTFWYFIICASAASSRRHRFHWIVKYFYSVNWITASKNAEKSKIITSSCLGFSSQYVCRDHFSNKGNGLVFPVYTANFFFGIIRQYNIIRSYES